MNKIIYSSITKKFVMALAGLFLLAFLPVHLSINFLLLKPEQESFNKAAHFMATFPVIRIIEIVLISSIIIHILWGGYLQLQNWTARPVAYATSIRSETRAFSRFMIYTGGTIMIFLILHFFNFYFVKLGIVEGDPENFYNMAHSLFKIDTYNYIYLTAFILLGFHLYHAISSASQTLGLNHKFWNPVVKAAALIYAIAIPLGFAFISITLWLFR